MMHSSNRFYMFLPFAKVSGSIKSDNKIAKMVKERIYAAFRK